MELDKKKLFSPGNSIFYILALIVFYLAFHFLAQYKDIEETFRHIQPIWLIAAAGAQLLTYTCSALIFYIFLDKKSERISLWKLLKIAIVSVFINQIVPAGGLAGNGFIFDQLVEEGTATTKAFASIIIDSLSLYVAILLILIGGYAIYAATAHIPIIFSYVTIAGVLLYGILGGLVILLTKKKTLQWVHKKLSRFRFIKNYLEEVEFSDVAKGGHDAVKIFLRNKQRTALVIIMQLGIFFADTLTIFAIVHGLGLHANFFILLFCLLLTFVAGALPVSPGGLLLYEGAMTYFYTLVGIPFHAALIITLLYRVLSFWLPIPIGLFLYRNIKNRQG